MIYNIMIKNDFDEDKNFFLTADNTNQLYRRVLQTYGVTKDKIEILEEYKETDDWGYELVKSYRSIKEVPNDILTKSKELFKSQRRLCSPWKEDYMNRHGMTEIPIEGEKDLYDLIPKYKKIKVYWETGEKRGQHRYYALVKE